MATASTGGGGVGAITGPPILSGDGSPEGVVSAAIGSMYRSIDTGTLYIKETGIGIDDIGWSSIAIGADIPSYDLDGDGIVDAAEGLSESNIYTYQDHFLTGAGVANTNATAVGGAAAGILQGTSEVNHPGIFLASSGLDTGGYAYVRCGEYYCWSGSLSFRSVFSYTPKPGTGTSLNKVYIGMGIKPPGVTYPGTDFIGFVFDPASGMTNAANNWGLLTRKASVSTYTNTGYAHVDTYNDVSFNVSSSGVYYKIYSWGGVAPAKSGPITTNVPLLTTGIGPVMHMSNSPTGTGQKAVVMDLWEVAYKPSVTVSTFRGINLIQNF